MNLSERPNLDAVQFLDSISLKQFTTDCVREAELNGEKPPNIKDIKTWHTVLKQFCKSHIKNKGVITQIYHYSQNTPAGLGGRLFCSGSIQSIWNVYRGLLMRGIATDIDMKNCHPVLLRYICKKHDIDCPNLEYYINHRDDCLSKFESKQLGKISYLVSTNSDKYTRNKDTPEHFKRYDREVKQIQKQLVELPCYKDLFDTVSDYQKSRNYNGSAINRILCYYENIVLHHCIHAVNMRGIEIAVLMFDGLMVYGDYYSDPNLLHHIETYVESQMKGLSMQWAYKEHDDSLHISPNFNPETDGEFRHAENEDAASDLIIEDLRDRLKYSNSRIFIRKDRIWISDFSAIENYLLVFIASSNIKKMNQKGEWTSFAQNHNPARCILRLVLSKIRERTEDDAKFYDSLHSTTKARLCFRDGVLDMPSRQFHLWDELPFEINSTTMIPYDYADYYKTPDRELAKHILEKVFSPLFEENTPLALQFLARAIAGHAEDKNWMSFVGKRDCGKGVIYDGLATAFGKYVQAFELGNILTGDKDVQESEIARKLYFLLDYEFVRVAIAQETPSRESTKKLNGQLFKKIQSGGDMLIARRNYDTRDTYFRTMMSLVSMGNNDLKLTDSDIMEHCLAFGSSLQFKQQGEIDHVKELYEDPLMWKGLRVGDPTIKDKMKTPEWRNAIVIMILDYYSDSAVEITRSGEEDDNSPVLRLKILQSYEITGNQEDRILYKTVEDRLNDSNRRITSELKLLGVEKKKMNTRDEWKNKTCFVGLKERIEE